MKIAGRPVIQFIDNDSARLGLLRGYSPVMASAELIGMTWQEDIRLEVYSWYGRVASASNPGDSPSRMDWSLLESWGGVQCSPRLAPPPDEWGGWRGTRHGS